MKHIWVVESTSGKKWRPAADGWLMSYYTRKDAKHIASQEAKNNPGLRWRIAKYVRVGG